MQLVIRWSQHVNDRPIRIKDVATVAWDIEPMRGDAGMGTKLLDDADTKGYPGVILKRHEVPWVRHIGTHRSSRGLRWRI
jgi:hypothetical protein